jgi:Holliday junction resolvasome RuvABC endonuclease subunit
VTLLALDPSSTRTGYAVFAGELVDAGLLTPRPRKLDFVPRIHQMAADVRGLIEQYLPEKIVIEITSGHVGHRHKGHGAGLSVYGMAVGYLLAVVEASGRSVSAIEENVWTRGVPKTKRTAMIAAMYRRQYNPANDPGGDVADAIGLGRFFLAERKVKRDC